MKDLIYLLFLLWVWVLPVNSQSVFLAPRAGLNLSTITQTDGDLKSGLNFGISGEYMHTSRLAAEVGLYYSMQGTKFTESASPEHNYMNIPILFKYYLGKGSDGGVAGGLNFFAGPQIDVKAVVNKVPYAKEYKDKGEGERSLFDMTRPFGASAVIGVGYLFDIGLVLSANLNLGLTNKAKERYASSGSYKDLVAQINFGYRFSFR
jgi:hypothetical protein